MNRLGSSQWQSEIGVQISHHHHIIVKAELAIKLVPWLGSLITGAVVLACSSGRCKRIYVFLDLEGIVCEAHLFN